MKIIKNSIFSNWMSLFIESQLIKRDVVKVIDDKNKFFNQFGRIENIKEYYGHNLYLLVFYPTQEKAWFLSNQLEKAEREKKPKELEYSI